VRDDRAADVLIVGSDLDLYFAIWADHVPGRKARESVFKI
jgi:hypothetical protein